jgi:hypothetical protein
VDEMRVEHLQRCGHWADGDTPEGGPCGDGAACRVSWDEGRTWLYLCDRHAERVLLCEGGGGRAATWTGDSGCVARAACSG